MGLDVYVGTLTRYLTGDWETIVQRMGREAGLEVRMIRPEAEDAITDPEEVRAIVLQWKGRLCAAIAEQLGQALNWDESANAPYFTDKPAWDGYGSLLLWAAYDDHPQLKRPERLPQTWDEDAALERSRGPGGETRYPSLLKGAEIWLPLPHAAVFEAPDVTMRMRLFASSVALLNELNDLNSRTWSATPDDLDQWVRDPPFVDAPLEEAARFGFAVMHELATAAVRHRLPMLLDY